MSQNGHSFGDNTSSEHARPFREHPPRQFLAWLHQFSLGRKRLLDTLLAATYRQAGIQSLLTTNQAAFLVFGVFTCMRPEVSTTHS